MLNFEKMDRVRMHRFFLWMVDIIWILVIAELFLIFLVRYPPLWIIPAIGEIIFCIVAVNLGYQLFLLETGHAVPRNEPREIRKLRKDLNRRMDNVKRKLSK